MRQLSIDTPYEVGKIHLYMATVNGTPILFDTGPPTEEGWTCLRENVDLDRLKYVFITHWHPEHCGLAKSLAEEVGAEIIISRRDARKFLDIDRRVWQLGNVFSQLGFPEQEIERMMAIVHKSKTEIPLVENYRLLEESPELLEELGLSYLCCPWHSQSDVVYLLGEYAITGDVILRNIFSAPFLDVDQEFEDGRRFDNYAAFCETISKLKRVEDCIFLPSHQGYLESVDEWVQFFVSKLVERAQVAAAHLKSGKNVYETVVSIFGEKLEGRFLTYLKTSEVVFIADFLNRPELLLNVLKSNNIYPPLETMLSGIV